MTRPRWSFNFETNIPAAVLVLWAFARLFLRWFGNYDYYGFGMIQDLAALWILFHLAVASATVLKGKVARYRDEL